MPTVIHMLVEVSVPVPDKDAIRQSVTTQALQSAAQYLIEAAESREGKATMSASIKKMKDAPQQQPVGDPLGGPHSPPGDTPETMPVELPK